MNHSPPSTTTRPLSRFLRPRDLSRLRNLLFGARLIVEGYYAGRHRSPFHDFSSELSDFRPYCPGDDVRALDWKAFARSDRLYVKQYRKETDMSAHVVVDVSASMAFRGAEHLSKYEYCAQLAAALSFLMLRQGDRPGLTLCSDSLRTYLAPGSTLRHLYTVLHALEHAEIGGGTRLAAGLRTLFPLARKRGLLIVLSDLLEDPAELMDALAMFTHRGFCILLLQILSEEELNLPRGGPYWFVDPEESSQVFARSEAVRASYRAELERHIRTLERGARARGMDYALLRTSRPYVEALTAYATMRGR